MKRSEELLGLSVISIEDGKEVGCVSDLVINAAKGCVEFLVVDNGPKYMGVKILPFKLIEGVGEYAITIQSSSSITDITDQPEINDLLEKNVRIKGTKVLTKKGRLMGTVSEFLIDDDSEGKIAGCELTPAGESEKPGVIPSEQIVTFGKDVLIINAEAAAILVDSLTSISGQIEAKSKDEPTSPVKGKKQETSGEQEPSEAARLFEERQRKFLIGRKVSKRIETESGEVIAEEGELITEELLDKAKEAGKFMELSMNTK
ncbi:MAG: photosystem reaction center subunit H [Firmicutes bacterium HGW-Firmicutes-8]|nr:MAG: photosystem reaction center subunit H [Firmicutes bacterium HGW-Firmicutes-8]